MGPREAFPKGALDLVKGPKNVTLQLKDLVQYVLVKSIPPRLNFRKSVIQSLPMISREMVEGWKEGMAKV
jgi:hypothetical protein